MSPNSYVTSVLLEILHVGHEDEKKDAAVFVLALIFFKLILFLLTDDKI